VVFRGEDDAGSLDELDGLGEAADADLGAGQVGEDRDRLVELLAGLTDPANDLTMGLGGPVGEVDAENVDAGAGEGENHVWRGRGRPDGRYDFGTQAHPLATGTRIETHGRDRPSGA